MPTNEGPVDVGFGWVFVTPSSLYYSTYVVQAPRGNLGALYLDGSLVQAPLGGGTPTTLLSGYLFMKPVLAPSGLVLGASGVPSSQGDVIFSLPSSGGPPAQLAALDGSIVNGFGTDGTYVYFSDDHGIEALPLAADAGASDVFNVLPGLSANIVAPFAQSLVIVFPQGEVETIPLPVRPASAASPIGTCPAGQNDPGSCGSDLCWLAGTNTIERLAPSGAPVAAVTLTGAVASGFAAAFTATDVFVIGSDLAGTASLARVPLAGGAPVVLATMPAGTSRGVAVDAECVYWAGGDGIYDLSLDASGCSGP
jgi:hypothetical protein